MKSTNYCKKIVPTTAILLTLMLGVGCNNENKNAYYSKSKMEVINKYLTSRYLYDVDSVDQEQIADSIYANYVGGLENQATYYLGVDEFKQAEAAEEGNYLGVGLKMTWESDGHSILITEIIPGSSAEKANLQVGDHIVAIDGIEVVSVNRKQVVDKLEYTGEKEITYKVKKKDGGQEEIVALKAELVLLDDLSYEIKDQVGYIKLESIRNGTSTHLETIMKELDEKQVKGIILDLRELYTNNVEEVSKISDLFLDKGIAFKLKQGKEKLKSYEMTSGKYEKKVVLLTDRYTGGVTEALVSALKDVAVQMGTDTYGLAYVSELIPLQDGSGLSVATGILYDKYGEALSDKGIEPDQMVFMTEAEKVEYIEKGSVSKENDSLLKKAMEQF